MLNGDGVVCVDLDKCIDAAGVAPWASEILDAMPATYVEVSPSGRGLHVWGRGDMPAGRVLSVNGHNVEVYGNGRYLTVTGNRFGSAPSRLASLPLDALLGLSSSA